MNLYLISQSDNNKYDTYDSAVVAALTEELARMTYPGHHEAWVDNYDWASSPDFVQVKFLSSGYDGPTGVILASFNAG